MSEWPNTQPSKNKNDRLTESIDSNSDLDTASKTMSQTDSESYDLVYNLILTTYSGVMLEL